MIERPFDAVRRALHDISHKQTHSTSPSQTLLDHERVARTGVPEIVYGRGKSDAEIAASLRALAARAGRAIATRCSPTTGDAVRDLLGDDFEVSFDEIATTIVVARPGRARAMNGGRVAIVTAGSSDAPVAAEAALIAREMGAEVFEVRDVGVAGLHRLVQPLESIVAAHVDAIVVVAGMDGALPSVVAGLVPIPVIGLPTSTGYGFGGDGVGALMAMIQSCAPGLVVVNVDNGVGAGVAAARIANRMAAARRSSRSGQGGDGPNQDASDAIT